MTSGTRFEQGDILIVPFPFSDLSAIKQRPVLVLSKDNDSDIITCGITSNLKDAAHSVLIENKSLSSGAIPTTSRIRVDKLFTLERSIVRKRIARIDRSTMQRVKKEFVGLV